MKLIFLDFDGVLNSIAFSRTTPQISDMCTSHDIDPAAVDRIKGLMCLTAAKIVVSSSWRIILTLPELQDILEEFGIDRHDVLGVTPRMHGKPGEARVDRGFEIEKFVEIWPSGRGRVESFVIIDDSNDMGNLHHRHVHTSYNFGFLDEHIGAARTILETEWDPELEIP